MMKIGSEAPIGSNAKMGAKAWGTVTEESGTVLFDGVITLSSGGAAPLAGTVTLADALEAGYYYMMIGRAHV